MANFPFYAVPEDEVSILSLLGFHPLYPDTEKFVDGLREAMSYCGDDWPLKGEAFQNYMKDIRPALQREHALLKMYFSVRTREAKTSSEQELVEMRRYGRCSLSDALYLISALQQAHGGTPLSFAMARQAGPKVIKPLRETGSFKLDTAVNQFQRFQRLQNATDTKSSSQTPDELRYGFSELNRVSKRYKSSDTVQKVSKGACQFLTAQSGIEQQDAEMFADILTSSMGLGAFFQRTREAEAAEAKRRRLEAEAAEAKRRRLEADAAEIKQRIREAEAEQRIKKAEAEAAEAERRRLEAEAGTAEAEKRRLEAEAQAVEAERRRREAAQQQQQDSQLSKKTKKSGFLLPALVAVVLFFALHGIFSQDTQTDSPQSSPEPPQQTAPVQSSRTEPVSSNPPPPTSVDTDSAMEEPPFVWDEPQDEELFYEENPEAEIAARLSYFMDNCDQEYFDKSLFVGFDKEHCVHARNAIYAHAGRMFSDNSNLQAYYSQFDWYQPSIPPKEFQDSMLNRYQTVNLYRLLSYETECGYRSEQYVQSYNRLKTFINNCDRRTFSKSQLSGFDKDMCMLARNAIYAKSGRKFNSEYLAAYFNECVSWYNPRINPDDFSDNLLNAYQTANRDVIVEYETENGFR